MSDEIKIEAMLKIKLPNGIWSDLLPAQLELEEHDIDNITNNTQYAVLDLILSGRHFTKDMAGITWFRLYKRNGGGGTIQGYKDPVFTPKEKEC